MRIALIHAVKVAIAPVEAAFAQHWPQAQLMNLLDDSLSADVARDGSITPAMFARFETLAQYAEGTGCNAILFTCSAFGPAIAAVAAKRAMPVLKPNEAMFDAALDLIGADSGKVGLLASFTPSMAPMADEFKALAQQRGSRAQLITYCVPEALPALNASDAARHDTLLAAAAPHFADCQAVMLAQFSTARARPAMEAALGAIGASALVLTSPDAAVRALQKALARH